MELAKTNRFIKHVAIYLRKSRGEEDKDLDKHRMILVEMAEKYGWQYVEYVEIANSETIEYRPRFKQLLDDVKNQMYDAVLVVDHDRLGRGEKGDQAIIDNAFKKSDTLIVTPQKIYNLNDESDAMLSDVQGLLARFEYQQIKKRLLRGKKTGAKMGNWTNGRPPFPYDYDQATKKIKVNQEKLPIYRFMVDKFIEGYTFYEIAWELNKMGSRSPKGSFWHENTIRRIVIDETHLGRIISNKTEGSAHSNKNTKEFRVKPRTEWIIVENCHEKVKTLEEHDKILLLLKQRKIIPSASMAGKYPLSGIVRCGQCGKTMQFIRKPQGSIHVKKCQHADPFGNQCGNRGGDSSIIIEAIKTKLREYEEKVVQNLENDNGDDLGYIQTKIRAKLDEIEKKEKAIERIDEAYEAGAYDVNKYKERMNKAKSELSDLEEELELLQNQLTNLESVTNEERLTNIRKFFEEIEANPSTKDLNRAYKSIIDSVIWTRPEEDIEITVNFL